jgi:hypothetical protein
MHKRTDFKIARNCFPFVFITDPYEGSTALVPLEFVSSLQRILIPQSFMILARINQGVYGLVNSMDAYADFHSRFNNST